MNTNASKTSLRKVIRSPITVNCDINNTDPNDRKFYLQLKPFQRFPRLELNSGFRQMNFSLYSHLWNIQSMQLTYNIKRNITICKTH